MDASWFEMVLVVGCQLPKHQPTIILFTIEAKYKAFTETCKEALWLQGLVHGFNSNYKTVALSCNNMGVICLVRNLVYHKETKHVLVNTIIFKENFA